MSNPEKPFALPAIQSSELIFEESIIHVRRDILALGNEPPYPYYSLETLPYAVVVLATTTDGSYLFIEEYRHPTKKIVLGLPAGYLDENESPLDAAKRELLEETGYQAESFLLIGSAYPYTGVSGQKNFYVKATGAARIQNPQLERSEIIRPRPMSPSELNQAIDQGIELDGTVGTALFFNSRLYRT